MQQNKVFELQPSTPFAQSMIWQLSTDYYHHQGVNAWRTGEVPHHMTSNSRVGNTYAELIFAFLKDRQRKGQNSEMVYILELGAGHGRLAFHILKHLELLTAQWGLDLPPYCYVLSDIVEDNLTFFSDHPQFQTYYENGKLDLAYYDGMKSEEIVLRNSAQTIEVGSLEQPLLAIANYFFDSIPTDLFRLKDGVLSSCAVALETQMDPDEIDEQNVLKEINLVYELDEVTNGYYNNNILDPILNDYRSTLRDTYLFFPFNGFRCIENLRRLSTGGLMLLTMDKGTHQIQDLEHATPPKMANHGSMSFNVNYHAFETYCRQQGGVSYFPQYSTFHLELGCLLFVDQHDAYHEVKAAYERVVNQYGPDDFTSFTKFCYANLPGMNFMDLMGWIRLGFYDSTLFINAMPRIKEVAKEVTFNERDRLARAMHEVWNMYFTLNESYDLAFEIGGLFYGLAMYQDALIYFNRSTNLFGITPDVYYNRALCYYQLREDTLFLTTLNEAKRQFPNFKNNAHLETLDLGAA